MTKLCACVLFCAFTNSMKPCFRTNTSIQAGNLTRHLLINIACGLGFLPDQSGQNLQPWPGDSPDNNSLLKWKGSGCLL